MSKIQVSIARSINSEYATNNVIYYQSLSVQNSMSSMACPHECYIKFSDKNFVKKAIQLNLSTMINDYIYLNSQDRKSLNASIND